MKTFVESQFEVMQVYGSPTKASSYEDICRLSVWSYLGLQLSKKEIHAEDICWVSVWSYVSLWLSNKIGLLWRHLLSLSLKLCKVLSFKQLQILMNKFVECQFEVMQVYEFQTKPKSYEDICWDALLNYVSLWVSNKR